MGMNASDLFFLVAAAAFTLLLYAIYRFIKSRNYFKERNIPYVESKYLLASDPGGLFMRHSLAESWDKIYKRLEGHKIGGFFQISPAVMIRDPEYIHMVLISAFDHFTDRTFPVDEETNPLEAHLFFLKGKRWRFLRNKVSPIFSSGKLRWMFEEMDKCGNDFVQCMDDVADGKDVDILDKLARYATDVIGSCAFGLEGESLKNPNSPFRQIGKEIFDIDSFNWNQFTFIIRQMVPKLFTTLRIPTLSRAKRDYFCSLISNVMNDRKKTGAQRKDMIHLLIQLKEKGEVEVHPEEKENIERYIFKDGDTEKIEITDNLLTAQCLVFLIAGFETTSRTIHNLLYFFSEHKDIQERARKEVMDIKAKYGQFNFDALKEMKFLDKCLSETLRFFPLVPMIRECTKDFRFPDGTLIEKGTTVVIPAFSIQRDAKYFPDPLKFDPNRFDTVPARGTYMPFGSGPRICIGMRFSLVEIKIVVARFLERYRFDPSPLNVNIEEKKMSRWSLTLAPENGFHVRISKLNVGK